MMKVPMRAAPAIGVDRQVKDGDAEGRYDRPSPDAVRPADDAHDKGENEHADGAVGKTLTPELILDPREGPRDGLHKRLGRQP
ncbi:MAG: hypothetical protein MZW92_25610 [Comamonadaceae bacterium]|nr:hypothetical protein [Comamonadaceae bacterium]